MQPNDERGMAQLDPTLDNHVIAATGYSNYPQFIPNYAGDNDPELEIVVPNFVRLTIDEAYAAADAAPYLSLNTISHVLTASYIVSDGTTVRVTAYDTAFGNWGNASGAALIGIKIGDELDLEYVTDTSEGLGLGTVTVTATNNDGSDSWFEFKSATDLGLDTAAAGEIYAGPNLVNVVTVQRPNRTSPGAIIVIEAGYVNVRYVEAP